MKIIYRNMNMCGRRFSLAEVPVLTVFHNCNLTGCVFPDGMHDVTFENCVLDHTSFYQPSVCVFLDSPAERIELRPYPHMATAFEHQCGVCARKCDDGKKCWWCGALP